VGKFTVIGEQEKAFGKIVEAAHRIEALAAPRLRHEVEHGLATFGIARGRYYLHGFVQEQPAGLGALFAQGHGAAVQGYPVAGHHALAGIVRRLAVHAHRTCENVFIGFAARADARIGQSLVQSYSFSHTVLEVFDFSESLIKKGLFAAGTMG
jgi:hypothetical protein